MKKLTIIYQFGGRPYIERITRDFIKESLSDFIDYEWIELDCSNLTIGKGYNELIKQVKTEYVMTVLDDYAFFPTPLKNPNGDWVSDAITILDKRRDIGLINLRKINDNEELGKNGSIEQVENTSFMNYEPFGNRGWSFNPSIMRTEVLKQIVPLDENDISGNIAEASGWGKWYKLGLKTAKLNIPYYGVCFHLGWHRSCCFNYKDKQQEIIKKYYGK